MTAVTQRPLRPLVVRLNPSENARKENWQRWKLFLEAWGNYSVKLDIKSQSPDVQVTTFLSCIGSEGERLFNEISFDTPEDKQDLNKIMNKITKHFSQNPNDELGVPVESRRLQARYRFHTRVQKQGETLENFVTDVKKLAENCHFCNCDVDGLVRDQVLLGMADERMRQRFLQEDDIDLETLLELCQMSDHLVEPSDSSPGAEFILQKTDLGVAASSLPISAHVSPVSKPVALGCEVCFGNITATSDAFSNPDNLDQIREMHPGRQGDNIFSLTSLQSAAPSVPQKTCSALAPTTSVQILELSGVAPPCGSSMPVLSRNEGSIPIHMVPAHLQYMPQSAPGSGMDQHHFLLPSSSESVEQLSTSGNSSASATSGAALHVESMHQSASNVSQGLHQAGLIHSQGLQQVDADVKERFPQILWQSSPSLGQAGLEVLQPVLPDDKELLLGTSLQGSQHLQQLAQGSRQSLQQVAVESSAGLQQGLAVSSLGPQQAVSVSSQEMQQPPMQSSSSMLQGAMVSSHAMLLGQQLQAAYQMVQDLQQGSLLSNPNLQQASVGSNQNLQQASLGSIPDLQQASKRSNLNLPQGPTESVEDYQQRTLKTSQHLFVQQGTCIKVMSDIQGNDSVERVTVEVLDTREPSSKDSVGNDKEEESEESSTWPACDECGKKFRTMKQVNRHKFIHRQRYRCSICLQELPGFRQYQRHRAQHAEAQPDCLPLAMAEDAGQAREEERVPMQVDGSEGWQEKQPPREETISQTVSTASSDSGGSPDADEGHTSHGDPAGRGDPAGHDNPPAGASSTEGTPKWKFEDIIVPRKKQADVQQKEDQESSSMTVPKEKKTNRKTRGQQQQRSPSTKTSLERKGQSQRGTSRKRQLIHATEEATSEELDAKISKQSSHRNTTSSRHQTSMATSTVTLAGKTDGRDRSSKLTKIRRKAVTSPRSASSPTAEAVADDGDESFQEDIDTNAEDSDDHDDVDENNESRDRKKKPRKDQPQYKCVDCGKVYRESRNLRIHRSANCLGGQGNPHCRLCGKVYTTLKRLQNHMISHHPKALDTGTKDSDGSDQTDSNPVKKYSDFNRQAGQRDLNVSIRVEEFVCKQCPKVFRNATARQHHTQQIHERLFTCSKCGEVSKGKDAHQAHLRTHVKTKVGEKSRLFVCTDCGKVCGSYYHLRKHRASVHLGETTPCDVCGKKFVDKNYLNYHKVIHTGEMPFWCDICNKGFKLSQGYKYHMRKHDGTSQYTCEYCGASFFQMSHLKYHIRGHTNDRPHACLECGKTFLSNSSLKRHAIVHSEERNCICELCGRGYKCEKYLQVHMKTHEKEGKNAAT